MERRRRRSAPSGRSTRRAALIAAPCAAVLALVGSVVALTGSAATGGAVAGRAGAPWGALRPGSAAPAGTRGGAVSGRATKLASSVSLTGAGGVSAYRLAAAGTANATGAVPVGTKPALPVGAKSLGAYPAQRPLSLDVVLSSRDPAGLTRLATAVSTPGSAEYRHFLAPGRFTSAFGATAAEVSAVRAALGRAGIAAGTVTDGFLLSVDAIPSQLRAAFGVTIERYRLPGGRVAFANTSRAADGAFRRRDGERRPRPRRPARRPAGGAAARQVRSAHAPAPHRHGRRRARALLGGQHDRQQLQGLDRRHAREGVLLQRPLRQARLRRRRHCGALRARALRAVRHRGLPVLLRHPRPDHERAGGRRRRHRARLG